MLSKNDFEVWSEELFSGLSLELRILIQGSGISDSIIAQVWQSRARRATFSTVSTHRVASVRVFGAVWRRRS